MKNLVSKIFSLLLILAIATTIIPEQTAKAEATGTSKIPTLTFRSTRLYYGMSEENLNKRVGECTFKLTSKNIPDIGTTTTYVYTDYKTRYLAVTVYKNKVEDISFYCPSAPIYLEGKTYAYNDKTKGLYDVSGCNVITYTVKKGSTTKQIYEYAFADTVDKKIIGVEICADRKAAAKYMTCDVYERIFFDMQNIARISHGLKALKRDAEVDAVALGHSLDMKYNCYFSHSEFDGSSWRTRFDRAGVTYGYMGENIQSNYSSPASGIVGFMNSSGHRKNILNGKYTYTGIGFTYYKYLDKNKNSYLTVNYFKK